MLAWLMGHPYLGFVCANALCTLLCWGSVLAHYIMLNRFESALRRLLREEPAEDLK